MAETPDPLLNSCYAHATRSSVFPEELMRPAQRDGALVLRLFRALRERWFGIRHQLRLIDAAAGDDLILEELRNRARAQQREAEQSGGYCLLFTGATGFVGMECVQQFAGDPRIRTVYCLIRSRVLRERRSGQILSQETALQRGQALIEALRIPPESRAKFKFLEGDIEQPLLGIGTSLNELAKKVTHVVHMAASVEFEEPYEQARRTNVDAVQNALEVAAALRDHPDSRFVSCITTETAYIHGRTLGTEANETALHAPRGLYNNTYELTKAMGSIVARRFMWERKLPVIHLLPAIVVGRTRCGSNHGDRKVLNAPINVIATLGGLLAGSRLARMAAHFLVQFPADPDATLNLVAVDRISQAVGAALSTPEAIGRRIHLGSPEPVRLERIATILRQEFGIQARILNPMVFLALVLPLLGLVARRLRGRMGRLLSSLVQNVTVFRTYCERLQPIHRLAGDQEVLGLEAAPRSEDLVRIACRHNRYVFLGSKSRQLSEIKRRASEWRRALTMIESRFGRKAIDIEPPEFHAAIAETLDLATFTIQESPPEKGGARAQVQPAAATAGH